MALAYLDSVSLPGDPAKPNDDACAFHTHAAVVLDGATGLGEPLLPGDSDAAWVARAGADRLLAHLHGDVPPGEALRLALHDVSEAFARLRRRPPVETSEIPFASMMLAAEASGGVEFRWFGDCAAIAKLPDDSILLVGEALEKRRRERERVAELAASARIKPAAPGVRDVFLPALRRARNFVNTERGGFLFGPDLRAAGREGGMCIEAPVGTHLLLVSDGFLALVTEYEHYDIASLMHAALAKGLHALGQELRAIEDADPEGERFPRFKSKDDATALLLRVV